MSKALSLELRERFLPRSRRGCPAARMQRAGLAGPALVEHHNRPPLPVKFQLLRIERRGVRARDAGAALQPDHRRLFQSRTKLRQQDYVIWICRPSGSPQFSGTLTRPHLTISLPPGTWQGANVWPAAAGPAQLLIAATIAAMMRADSIRNGLLLKRNTSKCQTEADPIDDGEAQISQSRARSEG